MDKTYTLFRAPIEIISDMNPTFLSNFDHLFFTNLQQAMNFVNKNVKIH